MRLDTRTFVAAAVAALLALTLAATGARAQQPPSPDDTVTLNFVNADIHAVVKAVSEMTGRNFLIDPRVQGTVNIVAPRPVPRNMVFPILLSALRVQGFAAVGGDLGYVNIVPESDAKFYAGARDARHARGDQVVTEVFQLSHESAQSVVQTLRPLVTPNNVINAFPATNSIVITDYASNLERLRKVIATVDQPQPAQLSTIKLRYAAAVDVAQAVQRLLPEAAQPTGPGAPPRVALSIDARTNSLLVRAENPALAKRIRELAEGMDLPTAAGGNIHVVYLKNAQAERLAEALRAIISGQPSAASRAVAQRRRLGQPPPPGAQPVAAAAPAAVGVCARDRRARAGVGTGVSRDQLARHHRARQRVQRAAQRDRQARRAPRAGVRRSADRRDRVDQGRRVRHPVAGDPLGPGQHQRDHRAIGVQNFNNSPGSNIGQIARDPAAIGQGLSLGLIRGSITSPACRSSTSPRCCARSRATPTANILSTPNAAHARQRGGEDPASARTSRSSPAASRSPAPAAAW